MFNDLLKCEHWLRAHRLATAAWNLQHPGDKDLAPVRRYLEDELVGLPPEKFNALPLLALSLIDQLDRVDLERLGTDFDYAQLKTKIAQARVALTKEDHKDQKPSVVRAAQLVAELILAPTSNARSIAGFAREALDRSWDRCLQARDLRQALEKVPRLQVVEASTNDKIRAVAELAAIISRGGKTQLNWWPQVEYALLHRLLAWPLCTSRPGMSDAPGISYPLAVDVRYGRHDVIDVVNSPAIKLGDGDDGETQFGASLKTALAAAKDLWLSQNGSASKALKNHVEQAQLVVNTAPAAAITAPFGPAFGAYITGRSLEAFIAIIALGRLSGIDAIPPIVISGTIGDRVDRRTGGAHHRLNATTISPDDVLEPEPKRRTILGIPIPGTQAPLAQDFEIQPLDRLLGPVNGIVKKYEWALLARQFTTVILPHASLTDGPEAPELIQAINATRRDHAAFVQTLFAETLSTAADIAYGIKWRRYRTVRANDILHSMLYSTGPIDRTESGTSKALAFLKRNESTVARVPASMNIRHIVAALTYLNNEWAHAQEHRPAKRSIVFFRMVHDEPRARLLTAFFTAIGGHPAALQALLNASDLEEAISILAKVLNQAEPGRDAMFRKAPDIIVFILPSGPPLKTRSPIPFDEHLEFNQLFSPDTLGVKLRSGNNKPWTTQINRTRVLVVTDGGLGSLLPDGQAPERSKRDIYRKLGVFRFGFTQAMVLRVVDPGQISHTSVRGWLAEATKEGHLLYAGGRYFLSPATRQALQQNSLKPAEFAQAHMKAALAFAPYLDRKALGGSPVSIPGLINQEAADPAALHEAQFHMAAIDELEAETKRKHGRGRWMKAMGRYDAVRHHYQSQLGCVFEKPNWDLARYAVANPRFAAEYLAYAVAATRALINDDNINELPAIRLTATLGLFDKYLQTLRGSAATTARAELEADALKLAKACRKRIRELSKRAAASKKDGERTILTYQFVFASAHLAAMAMRPSGLKLGLSPRYVRTLSAGVRDAVLKNDGKPSHEQDGQIGYCPPPEWFTRYAASLGPKEVGVAIALYRIGREHRRGRIQRSAALFVNALGIVNPGSQEEAQILADLEAVRAENPYKLVALERHIRTIDDQAAHWQSGLPRFDAWIKTGDLSIKSDEVVEEDGDDEMDSDFRVGAELPQDDDEDKAA